MANEIDKALVTQFSDSFHEEAQQIRARFRDSVIIKPMSGDLFAYDGTGTVEAQEVFGRVQPVVLQELEHTRRKIFRRRFYVAIALDDMDVRGVLQDAQGQYAKAVVRAMERQFDRVVAGAAFADVSTGRDFETTTTFASEGRTVNATAGLTYEKLLEVKQNFIDDEIGMDNGEDVYLTITGKEHTALMGEIELINGDYSRDFVVERGQIVRALGMRLITFGANVSSPILGVSGTTRSNIAGSTRGICVGISKEMTVKILDRSDLLDTKQIQISGIIGAVRTEGHLLQKLTTTI